MLDAENGDDVIRRNIDFKCSDEMAVFALLISQNPDTRCLWIANATHASCQIQRLFELRAVGITIVLDNQIDVLKKLCDSITTHRGETAVRWDLFIDDYDFLYENTKSFVTNHRKIFRDVRMVKNYECLL